MKYLSQKQRDKLFNMTKPVDDKTKKQIDDLFLEQGYLFKENNKGHRTAYCTCCQERFDLDGLEIEGIKISYDSQYKFMKHNENAKCPLCGKSVTVKDSERGRSKLIDRNYVAVFQKLRNQTIVLRTFAVMRDYAGDYENIETKYSEHYRIYYKPGEVYAFKRRNVSGWYIDERSYFCDDIDVYVQFEQMADIPKNLKYPQGFNGWNWFYGSVSYIPPTFYNEDVVSKSKLFKYSEFDSFYCMDNDEIIHRYLKFYCKHPVLCERLMKEGFEETLSQILRVKTSNVNYRSKTVKGFFRMNKTELKFLRSVERKYFLSALQVKRYDLPLNKETLDYVGREYYSKKDITSYLERNNTPFDSAYLINYLVKQNSDFSIWRDYVGWLLKYDFELSRKRLFPRYLQQEHDYMMEYDKRCEAAKREKANKEALEKFTERILPTLKSVYSYSDDSYIVRPFENTTEIITEGQIQNICVGGTYYTDGYMKGKTYLFCLREVKTPDVPFCTIEVDTHGKLIQARMKRNASPPEPVNAFISKWQKEYKKRAKKYINNITKKEVA